MVLRKLRPYTRPDRTAFSAGAISVDELERPHSIGLRAAKRHIQVRTSLLYRRHSRFQIHDLALHWQFSSFPTEVSSLFFRVKLSIMSCSVRPSTT